MFSERVQYDTNGDMFGRDYWYEGEWRPVLRKELKNGIVIGDTWHHMELDTNGNWRTN